MARQDDVPDNPRHIACKNGHQVQHSTHIDNTAPSGSPPALPALPASALVWPQNSAASWSASHNRHTSRGGAYRRFSNRLTAGRIPALCQAHLVYYSHAQETNAGCALCAASVYVRPFGLYEASYATSVAHF